MGRKICTTILDILSVLNPGWMDLNRLKETEKVRREKPFNKRHMIYYSCIQGSL